MGSSPYARQTPSRPKKYLIGTIPHLRYKKARGMFSANARRTPEMPPSCYRWGCQGVDEGLICENLPSGRSGYCVRKKSRGRSLQISRKRRRASLKRETSMKRTRGIVAAIVRICNGWLIQFYAIYRAHPLLLSLVQPSSTLLTLYRRVLLG